MTVPFNPAAWLRRAAQRVRHAPGLRRRERFWASTRAPYRAILRVLAGRRGLPMAIGGHTIRLDSRVVNLNWETVEPEAYRAFAAQVRPGDVVYDVGAHFGTYSVIASRRAGPSSRVVAYEPCTLTREYLARHLAWNGVERQVTVRPLCCGALPGKARFFYRPGVPEGINGLVEADGLAETWVDVTTVDAEVALLGLVPGIIKIDVEGAELDVLRGAEAVLATHRPRLLLSLHPAALARQGLSPGAVVDWLASHRYRCDHVSEDQELHVLALPSGGR